MAQAGTAYVDIEGRTDDLQSQILEALASIDAQVSPEVDPSAITDDIDEAISAVDGTVDVEAIADTDPAQSEIDAIEGGDAEVTVTADTSQAQEGVDELTGGLGDLTASLGGEGGATGLLDGFAGAIAGAGVAGGAAATGGIGLLTLGVNDAVQSFGEAQAVAAETDAMLASLGAGAVTSADHIGNLSQRIMEYSGFSDEAVQQGANTLLMFDNINTQPVFDRALNDSADLARRLRTDVPSAARMLGIALQDPEAGMNRLRRAGVTLNDSQKETISSMMETGDVAGAQEVIFDALEGKIGNLAEAYGETLPGEIDRTNEAIDEHKEKIGEDVAPWYARALEGVEHFTAGVAGGIPGLRDSFSAGQSGAEGMAKALGELPPPTDQAAASLDGAAGSADDFSSSLINLDDRVQGYLDGVFRVPEAERALRGSFESLDATLGDSSSSADDVAVALQDIVTNAAGVGVATGDMSGAVDAAVFGLLGLQNQGKLSADQVASVKSQLESLPGQTNANVDTPGATESRSQVQRVTDALFGIPPSRTSTIRAEGLSTVYSTAVNYRRELDQLDGKRVTSFVGIVTTGSAKTSAVGGPLEAGELSLVGEEGPEMFVPNTGGNIIPAMETASLMMGRGGGHGPGQAPQVVKLFIGEREIGQAIIPIVRDLERELR